MQVTRCPRFSTVRRRPWRHRWGGPAQRGAQLVGPAWRYDLAREAARKGGSQSRGPLTLHTEIRRGQRLQVEREKLAAWYAFAARSKLSGFRASRCKGASREDHQSSPDRSQAKKSTLAPQKVCEAARRSPMRSTCHLRIVRQIERLAQHELRTNALRKSSDRAPAKLR